LVLLLFIAGNENGCNLDDVMALFSKSTRVPPLGFEKQPTLVFEDSMLATASTCDLVLRLPTVRSNYENFKDALILSFKSNDGFGRV